MTPKCYSSVNPDNWHSTGGDRWAQIGWDTIEWTGMGIEISGGSCIFLLCDELIDLSGHHLKLRF